jgi:hypothetical protein
MPYIYFINVIEVAYIEDQRGAKSIHLSKILSNKAAFKKLAKLLKSEVLPPIYEC